MERHYGLKVGDKIELPVLGTDTKLVGEVTYLSATDNNGGRMKAKGVPVEVPFVCEWAKKV